MQFDAVQSGPANLNELRGTTGAKDIRSCAGKKLQGVML
jgi:hypothetical protein